MPANTNKAPKVSDDQEPNDNPVDVTNSADGPIASAGTVNTDTGSAPGPAVTAVDDDEVADDARAKTEAEAKAIIDKAHADAAAIVREAQLSVANAAKGSGEQKTSDGRRVHIAADGAISERVG